MTTFAADLEYAEPDAAAAAIAAAVDEALRPRAGANATHSRFARARERVSSTRGTGGVLRIDLREPLRPGDAPSDPFARETWAEPLGEEPERWDGLS